MAQYKLGLKSLSAGGGLLEDVLWTHSGYEEGVHVYGIANTSVSLNASLADYDYIKVETVRGGNGSNWENKFTVIIPLDDAVNSLGAVFGTMEYFRRISIPDNTHVYIGETSSFGSSQTYSDYCVPIKIYGVNIS